MLVAIVAIVAIAALTVAGLTWKISRLLGDKQDRLVSLENSLMDLLAKRQEAKIKIAARLEQQEIVEVAVDTGAASAEVVHKAVADVTFGVLDSIPVTEGVSKLVRGLHDGIAGSIYSTVRLSNKEAGNLAKGYIKMKADYDAARPEQPEQEEQAEQAENTPQQEEEPAPEKKGDNEGET
jgi:hypothetical protein